MHGAHAMDHFESILMLPHSRPMPLLTFDGWSFSILLLSYLPLLLVTSVHSLICKSHEGGQLAAYGSM